MKADSVQKNNKIQILVNAITHLLGRGILLDAAAVHYIDSTFSRPSEEGFRQILVDAESCETGTLYELIFFPDIRMQEQLEPVLAAHVFDGKDVENVIRFIQQKKIQARIRFSDNRWELPVQIPEASIRHMIQRLNIEKFIDARIIKTLQETALEASDASWIRVMLRNCRVQFFDPFVHVLCRCIEIMAPASDYFRPAFALLLDFLETTDPSKDIYAGLMHKKQILAHMISQAEKNDQLLGNASVEALMAAGIRIPAVCVEESRKKITLMDHLCLSIYGKTDMIEY